MFRSGCLQIRVLPVVIPVIIVFAVVAERSVPLDRQLDMGKTIRAMLEEYFSSKQVPLSQQEITGLMSGWLDQVPMGPKDHFDWLRLEIGGLAGWH